VLDLSRGYLLQLLAHLIFLQETRKPEGCEQKPMFTHKGETDVLFYNEFSEASPEAAGNCMAFIAWSKHHLLSEVSD